MNELSPARLDVTAGACIGDVVRNAAARLAAISDSPRLDAELLLSEISNLTRVQLLTHPERALPADVRARFDAGLARRLNGEPLAYIVGRREFYSLTLKVTPAVLVPRAETELLVDLVTEIAGSRRCRIADLGTGSGAIALALRSRLPDSDVTAVDADAAALTVARANAADLGLDVSVVQSDWFDGLSGRQFDVLVSNPPYVRSRDPHFDGPLRHEPRLALDGGGDGLDCYRRILAGCRPHLAPDGHVVLEHGYDQRDSLQGLAQSLRFAVESVHDDVAGVPRAVVLRPDPS